MYVCQPYFHILLKILSEGDSCTDRTGTGRSTITGISAQYDLREGFPILQERAIFFKRNVLPELAWMLSGQTKVSQLKKHGSKCNIWDPWDNPQDDLGPIYGKQWRVSGELGLVDQIRQAIHLIETEPTSRRIMVDSWSPSELHQMAIPPCHFAFQLHPFKESGFMDLTLYQRSADMFLGVPYNMAFYALLLEGLCKLTGYKARFLNHHIGDAHIYDNHFDQVAELMKRNHILKVDKNHRKVTLSSDCDLHSLDDFIFSLSEKEWNLEDYSPMKHIKAEVAV